MQKDRIHRTNERTHSIAFERKVGNDFIQQTALNEHTKCEKDSIISRKLVDKWSTDGHMGNIQLTLITGFQNAEQIERHFMCSIIV